MLETRRVNVETLEVSRKVLYNPLDIAAIREMCGITYKDGKHNQMIIRKNGVILQRPGRPKYLSNYESFCCFNYGNFQ